MAPSRPPSAVTPAPSGERVPSARCQAHRLGRRDRGLRAAPSGLQDPEAEVGWSRPPVCRCSHPSPRGAATQLGDARVPRSPHSPALISAAARSRVVWALRSRCFCPQVPRLPARRAARPLARLPACLRPPARSAAAAPRRVRPSPPRPADPAPPLGPALRPPPAALRAGRTLGSVGAAPPPLHLHAPTPAGTDYSPGRLRGPRMRRRATPLRPPAVTRGSLRSCPPGPAGGLAGDGSQDPASGEAGGRVRSKLGAALVESCSCKGSTSSFPSPQRETEAGGAGGRTRPPAPARLALPTLGLGLGQEGPSRGARSREARGQRLRGRPEVLQSQPWARPVGQIPTYPRNPEGLAGWLSCSFPAPMPVPWSLFPRTQVDVMTEGD